jgi:hypothetical protein
MISQETTAASAGAEPALVAGRYRLLAVVGAGGMGRVWRAHDELLDRDVAVKELVAAPADQSIREARAAARLDHPHVVRVYDVVRAPERSWIVMEFVEGRTLHDVIRDDGPLSHREAARIGAAVLSALRTAHAAGVLHRDVKPHNVLVGADGRVVLTDFGLARLTGGDGAPTGPLIASPHYVAPERARDGVSSAETDLWSLGATLYAAVEGRPPFSRTTVAESLVALAGSDPDEPRHPGPLHPVIGALLAREPGERPSADEAYAAMRAAASRPIGVSRVPAQRSAVHFRPAAVSPIAAPELDVTPEPPRRRPWRAPAVLVAATALLGAVTGVALAAGHDSRAMPAGAVPVACASSTAVPVTVSDLPAPSALPDGWLWHRDAAGFGLALPAGWTRAARGATVCFGDPDGARSFTVDSSTPVIQWPLAYWQAAEQAALSDGTLPGYRRIGMAVLPVMRTGADWEYSWQAGSGPRLHTRRVLLATSATREFVLRWTTREPDWAGNVALEQRIVASFDAS